MYSYARAWAIQTQSVVEGSRETELAAKKKPTADHLFVNNVRFLSMAAVVAMHTIETYEAGTHAGSQAILSQALIQSLKFGTIGFFLVSGFLLGDRIHQYSSLQYFRRRLKSVFAPWLVWFATYCFLGTAAELALGRIANLGFVSVCYQVKTYLFATAFWFVPNLMIALAILLSLRQHLLRCRLGFLFLLGSLFYSVNIYLRWVNVEHARAVFGFVFYLWLGAWGSRNFAAIEKWLERIPTALVMSVIPLTLALAMAETRLLVDLGSSDPLNTLRLTNQIYSIVVVLGIIKLRSAAWPKMLNVRQETFGIYLAHPLLLTAQYAAVKRIFNHFPALDGMATGLTWVAVPFMFLLTYGACVLIVRVFKPFRALRWTVGLRDPKNAGPNAQLPVLRSQKQSWQPEATARS